MTAENLCDDGRCKRVRMGEEKHLKHLEGKKSKTVDPDEFFRHRNQVHLLFFGLIVLGGFLAFLEDNPFELSPVNDGSTDDVQVETIAKAFSTYEQIAFKVLALILIGLAFAVLNKGEAMKMRDQIHRIESKLDKILERRTDVFQNEKH
ncbi:hypothetical protein JYT57_00200 [Nitrosarchaeum koreense]|nr:hypothetical protein [Nitrosarchaeum koreense]